MSLIGDALSHAVLPGVVVSFMIFDYNTFGFFLGAVAAGMISALSITWIQHHLPTKNDAAIGIIYTVMFALGVMGISKLSKDHGAHIDLKDFLFGNVLGVSNEDLWMTCSITLLVILAILIFYRQLFISTFQPTIAKAMGIKTNALHYFLMLLLSFAVVASLQTVGVILVVALLIAPTSTSLLLTDKLYKVIILSAILGLISCIVGMYGAIQLETTPGPAMAVVSGFLFLLGAFFAPNHGIIFKRVQKYTLKNKILEEDVMKQALKINGSMAMDQISDRLEIPVWRLKQVLNNLKKRGLVALHPNNLFDLSAEGELKAQQLVRAHRLWETYLVNQVGLSETQIHEDAEKFEHLLTPELLDQVDKELGYPEKDPHGSPIPAKHLSNQKSERPR
jgi:ABC-type Mn2+/Zn2+ transport system permease subunit/Mn-dependent DtxR family transcriptional regulator